LRAYDLVVNTTPLGMAVYNGNGPLSLDASPWPVGIPFPAGSAVYDLVYNPFETNLLHSARAAGLKASNGLGMLVEQAALSFEIWSGQVPPLQAMWQSLQDQEKI
jgi:shikimate dehydrogenase